MSSRAPSWQDRRAELLQEACIEVAAKVQKGDGLLRTIGSVAKEFDNTELGGGRRLKLAAGTLQCLWYRWQLHDQKKSAFALAYGHNGQRPTVDPLLLRLLIERTFQTGAPLGEVVENLKRSGVKISLEEIRRSLPKGNLRKLERSHRQLTEYRLKLDRDFIAAGAKWRKALLKHRIETLRKLLAQDAALERRILRHRDQLQRKFLQADARAVRRREQLQREFLTAFSQTV